MQKLTSQSDWIARAKSGPPAGGFGNFDPGIVIARGEASHVWDEDGNDYIDYLTGSGPMLLGHGHPEALEAVLEQLPQGMTFFANNAKGIELAKVIVDAVPCCEQVRFVASGGEADMYAIRLARAYTGRNKILKFEGGYHGMSAEAQMSLAPDTLDSSCSSQKILQAPLRYKFAQCDSYCRSHMLDPLRRSFVRRSYVRRPYRHRPAKIGRQVY